MPANRIIVDMRWRRESAEHWAEVNIVPDSGEPIFEMDTGLFKLGDGETPYNDLPYFTPGNGGGGGGGPVVTPGGVSLQEMQEYAQSLLLAHRNDATPHIAYDDGPSFLLIYKNAKV